MEKEGAADVLPFTEELMATEEIKDYFSLRLVTIGKLPMTQWMAPNTCAHKQH